MTRRDDAIKAAGLARGEAYILLARGGIRYATGGFRVTTGESTVSDHLPASALTNEELIRRIEQECPRPEPVCVCTDPWVVSTATYAAPADATCARCGRRYINPKETA